MRRRLALLFMFVLAGRWNVTAPAADPWWPGPDYPLPQRAAAPAWLLTQKLNFSRWDGGPLEVCKGMLSGWPYFNPPWPDVVDATSRWYDLPTVELADRMGYNFIWVTFSVGYSVEKERYQWGLLRPYVKACHERGIRVAAYMSSTNMFIDDMFVREPRSKDWPLLDEKDEPVPYGAASYARIGRTTRVLADITNPEWKAYMKERIDAAIDAGFDAIEYDNTSWMIRDKRSQQLFTEFLKKNGFMDTKETRAVFQLEVMQRLFREMLDHARKRKPDMVLFANVHRSTYVLTRGCTIISTEDGYEPGYYRFQENHEIRSTDEVKPVWDDPPVPAATDKFDPDMLVTNLGPLRLLKGLDEGWKPVLVEFGGRRHGHRFLNHYPPLAFQLAIGECNAALAGLQGFQEGLPLLDLYRRRPEVMKIAEAVNQAHRFVSRHQEYFLGARYKADVAFVTDDRLTVFEGQRPREGVLTDLARANVQFDVLFEDRLKEENLRRYACVVVYEAKLLSNEALGALTRYARQGGRMMIYGRPGVMDRWGQPRENSPLLSNGPWETAPDPAAILKFIRANITPAFEVIDCPYVLFTITEDRRSAGKRSVVHLLNYQKHPLENVRVRCPDGGKLELLSLTPDCERIGQRTGTDWVIPRLGVYSILIATR